MSWEGLWWGLKSVQLSYGTKLAIFHSEHLLNLPKITFSFPPSHTSLVRKKNKNNNLVLSLPPALISKATFRALWCEGWIDPQISVVSLISSHDSVHTSLHPQSIDALTQQKTFCLCRSYQRVSGALCANSRLGEKTDSQKCKYYGCLCKFPQNKTDIFTLQDLPWVTISENIFQIKKIPTQKTSISQ